MGVVSFPSVSSGLSTEQLADLVARMIKEVEWLANGNMDSANIRNIAGFNVDQTTLKHSSGIVGISGANPTSGTAIRFWSGNADPTNAPFRVTQAGIMTAVGGLFQSSTGYPRVEVNSSSGLIGAYQSLGNAIRMIPTTGPGTPAFLFDVGGVTLASIQQVPASSFQIGTFGTTPMFIQSGGAMDIKSLSSINLDPSGGLGINGIAGLTASRAVVTSINFVSQTYTFSNFNFTKGILTSIT
jgi:hypothetical protein